MGLRSWVAWVWAMRAAARRRAEADERRRRVVRTVGELLELEREDLAARLIEEERYVREAGERRRTEYGRAYGLTTNHDPRALE